MHAWTQSQYGTADVLVQTEVPEPTPAAGQIVVRPEASSVNSGDVRVMRGDPMLVRLAFGLRRPRVDVRGMDVAGVVVAIGAGVDDIRVGDVVVAEAAKAFADLVVVAAERAVILPGAVPPHVAALLPVAGGTALLALDRTDAKPGERVLVLGAAGGVGDLAVRLASARGARVTACARESGAAVAALAGAERVLPRGASTAELTADGRFDVVIDVSGDRPLRELRALLRDGGRAALVAGSGGRILGPVPRLLRAAMLTRKRARLIPITALANTERLRRLVEAAAAGLLPHVGAEYSDDQVPAALAYLDAGHAHGKVLIRFPR